MDTFSLISNEQLFAAFPEWRALARRERAEDGSSHLVVQVLPPVEAMVYHHGLLVCTSDEDVTVSFDFYHSHFYELTGDGDHFGTMAALEFIKQILSERVSVVSWWLDDEWRGSAQLEAGAAPLPPWWLESGSFNHIRVRSWRGSFNANLVIPQ
jgi:hypothetical protein